jgi:hypothetical protein
MSNTEREELTPVQWMNKCVQALYLELPESIADDVARRWNAAREYIYANNESADQPAKEATQEEAVELLKEIVEAVQRVNAIGWEQSMTKAKEFLSKQSKQ